VRDVKSPWFGVNVDTGNFHTPDPYSDLAKIAPYAVNVQVKVSMQPAGAPRAQADFARLAQILKDSGYRGYIVLEYEERDDPRQGVPRWTAEMKRAFSAALAG
jgi:sugar phosphate isomerase/epimerase